MAQEETPEQDQDGAPNTDTAAHDAREPERDGAGDELPRPPPHPTVVGIGASAGGLSALQQFFDHVPSDSGLAYVVVVHLSPEHESHMAELLQPHVSIPVQQVQETTPLEPNRVYVIPPNANISAVDTHLRLSELEEKRRERAPIDHFFRTLSRTHDGHAIGVILSGTGADGTLGVKAIKEKGGLVVVQDPNEAEYDGMPQSAIATGVVDLTLPIARMPRALIEFAQTEPKIAAPLEDGDRERDQDRILLKIFAQLRARTGRDFSRYKRATLLRRIARRMQLGRLEELAAYLEHLRKEPDEVRALGDDLLITVTSFFRDPEVYEVLESDVIPSLFEGKEADDEVRVWSVGCATGEEAYSLAMLLIEEAAKHDAPPRIQVFASDLHEGSLEKARDGFFSGDIESELEPNRLERFFVEEEGGYRIRKEVREAVVFAAHNLLGDPPFSRLDLIACRNVLIYLQRDVQEDVIDLFHYALKHDGHLVLGTSETIDTQDLFHLEDETGRIYRKRNVRAPEPRLPVFPLVQLRHRHDGEEREHGPEPIAYHALHQRLVDRHGPPSLLVNPEDKVVHLSQQAGQYLVHPGGELTASISKLVRSELRIELRSAVREARSTGESRRTRPVDVQFNGQAGRVVVNARPSGGSEEEDGFVLVLFEEQAATGPGTAVSDSEGEGRADEKSGDRYIRELEAELELTQERLNDAIREHEASQEEMNAANEELQSINEELRSTMEELETSKEELQSMNEELQTVNQENRHKVEELAQLSGDLQNLMAATDIATLFLDRKLRIMRFTPKVGELFNVRLTDRGRPLSDLTHRLGYDRLSMDAETVLDQLVPIEREIQDDDGHWYLTRVRPYRSVEDKIEGAVITFVDISLRKRAEEQLQRVNEDLEERVEARTRQVREQEERFRRLVESTARVLWTTDPGGQVLEDSPSWRAFTGQSKDEWLEGGWTGAVHPEDREHALESWRKSVEAEQPLSTEVRLYHADSSSYRWIAARAVPLPTESGDVRSWFGMNLDIDDLKRAEEQIRNMAARLTVAEQEERRRLAEFLHDDLQQFLYAVQMKLAVAHQKGTSGDTDALLSEAGRGLEMLESAVRKTKQLAVDLSPPMLEGEGLAEAVQWLRTQMRELHGLEVELRVESDVDAEPKEVRVLLFQVIRELLFNVAKHAGTDQVVVQLGLEGGWRRVTVTDRGSGFDAEAVAQGAPDDRSFGLSNVRERLNLQGGLLEIHSAPGDGTRIVASMPLAPTQ